jgi:site-specific DNA recombinase
MRIALYARVSTQRQTQTQTIEQQLDRLRHHVHTSGWPLPLEHIFRDDGYSGTTLSRPGLDRLRALAAASGLDRIFMTAPDRLARNYVHQVLLVEELQRFGCLVEFLDRPMSQDPHDQLLLQIRGAVAEYERSLIVERMRQGRQRKLQAGLMLPWTKAPYGYRLGVEFPRDPAGVTVEEQEAAVVRDIFAWYVHESGTLLNLSKRLRELGIVSPSGKRHWSTATLRLLLTNPAYTGQVFAGRVRSVATQQRRSPLQVCGHEWHTEKSVPRSEWIPVATIPALVDQDTFDLAQGKLAQNRQRSRRHNTAHEYLLRSLVSCGLCRLACRGRQVPSGQSYYLCCGKTQVFAQGRAEKCPARYIPVSQLDDIVWKDLCELLSHPQQVTDALHQAHSGQWVPHEMQASRESIRRGRVSLATQIERLTQAYITGVMLLEEYQRRRHEVEERDQALQRQEQDLEREVDRQAELAELTTGVVQFCQRVQEGLEQATFEQKRALIELLIDRVIVTNGEVEIRYVIPTSPKGERIPFCHLHKDYLSSISGGRTSDPHHLFTPLHL